MDRATASRGARVIVVVAVVALVLSACAPGENPAATLGDGGAGFWLGLWHGVIAPITFLISLFTDGVNVYEVNNNGNWYDFGFVLGAGILFGGRGVRRHRRWQSPDRRRRNS